MLMNPILALGIGAMAIYGAYSVVSCTKDMCVEKAKMLTKVMKKKEKHKENCGCTDSCEC